MSIFVQIASYRDPQLVPTIDDLIGKAKYPDLLTVAICHQYDPDDGFDNLDHYRNDHRFKIVDVDYTQSKGVCWARNCIQQLYAGEDYTLQIDSHSRFAHHWDEEIIAMICGLQNKGYSKPVLTGYPASYDPANDQVLDTNTPPLQMVITHFLREGIPMCKSETIPGWQMFTAPVSARFYSAGFCFTLGSFCIDVQHDPEIYFIGEEISIAVRAFTHGYDLFHPHKMLLWHQYTRLDAAKHWDDDISWQEKNHISFKKTRMLLGIDPGGETLTGKYALGSNRSLAEYEMYAGISFSRSGVQNDTLSKAFPLPNYAKVKDKEWYARLLKYHELEIVIDSKMLSSINHILFTVLDSCNNTIHVKKIDNQDFIKNKNDNPQSIIINTCFFTCYNPVTWVAQLISETNESIKIIKGRILFDVKNNNLPNCNL